MAVAAVLFGFVFNGQGPVLNRNRDISLRVSTIGVDQQPPSQLPQHRRILVYGCGLVLSSSWRSLR